jgi:hypothetical protein
MSFAFALMLAQVMVLVVSVSDFKSSSVICTCFGVMIHFSWLLAFFWMNVCTFHLFRTLTRMQISSQMSGKRLFILYHMYSIVMAVGFVSINIVVSFSTYGNIGYGERQCYISSQTMIIYTFCIPLSFVVLSNIGLFMATLVTIIRRKPITRNVQHKKKVNFSCFWNVHSNWRHMDIWNFKHMAKYAISDLNIYLSQWRTGCIRHACICSQ